MRARTCTRHTHVCTHVHTRLCSDAVPSARGREGGAAASPVSAGLGSRAPRGRCALGPGGAFPGRASTPRRRLLSGAPRGRAPPPRTPPSAARFPSPRPHPAPSVIPLRPGGSGRGEPSCGAGLRAASAREPGLCGVWVRGHWAPRWSPRSGASPHPASAVPSQQTGSPREGAPWPLRPGQPACAPPPAGCFAKTAPGLGPRRRPGLLRSLVSLGHLGSLPTGRSQPHAGRGPLARPPPFPLASSLWCWACSPAQGEALG